MPLALSLAIWHGKVRSDGYWWWSVTSYCSCITCFCSGLIRLTKQPHQSTRSLSIDLAVSLAVALSKTSCDTCRPSLYSVEGIMTCQMCEDLPLPLAYVGDKKVKRFHFSEIIGRLPYMRATVTKWLVVQAGEHGKERRGKPRDTLCRKLPDVHLCMSP
jgi:hypothetical protein